MISHASHGSTVRSSATLRWSIKKLTVLCAVLLLLLPLSLQAAPPGNPSSWTLVWSDEFNGPTLDLTKWRTSYHDGSRTNNDELEWYVDSPVYHTISNGVLSLMATKTVTSGSRCNGTTCPYTSAMIESDGMFYQMYGYFEASMQLPKGQGLWPAFWLLPYPDTWPPEIDIMENLGNDTKTVYLSNHWTSNYPGVSNSGDQGGSVTTPYTGADYSTAFHTFGVAWTPSSITWYIDGVQRCQVTKEVPIAGYGVNGMYPVLNLAVGGSWPGAPNATTVFPAYLKVDYVRVYAGTAASGGSGASYTLTVNTSGTGSGTVSTNPSGTKFSAGEAVTLTAVPNTSSTFTGWSGACSGTGTTCSLTINSNESVTAMFASRHRTGR